MGDAKDGTESDPAGLITLKYFDLFARGAPIGLALMHSGVEWKGVKCGGGKEAFADWSSLKPTLAWRCLPVLEIPELGTVGQELAILNVLGSMFPKLRGVSAKDYATSQQLLSVGEDVYQKICKYSSTMYSKAPCTLEEFETFWKGSNPTAHNKKFGLKDHFGLVEEFAAATGYENTFTADGVSIGECKLFYILELTARMMESDEVIKSFPLLHKFYVTFREMPATLKFLETGGGFAEPLSDYFKPISASLEEYNTIDQ